MSVWGINASVNSATYNRDSISVLLHIVQYAVRFTHQIIRNTSK